MDHETILLPSPRTRPKAVYCDHDERPPSQITRCCEALQQKGPLAKVALVFRSLVCLVVWKSFDASNRHPPAGVFLTALTHIQDGSKDYLPGDLVNLRKRQKSSEVLQDLQRWQTQSHNFGVHPLPSVVVFINESLEQVHDRDTSEVFWQLSLEREPKEKDEEKLAKWLSDSGLF